jgi:hypothetical protein
VEKCEKLILNINVFLVSVWGMAIFKGTDTECYFVCCEGLGSGKMLGIDTEYYCVFCEVLNF